MRHQIVSAFDMTGDAAEVVLFFCQYIAVFFIFSGMLFVANASFNNLGKAKYSTFFNVGKATLGTIPFVYFGAQWGQVYGVLIGQVIGAIIFGVAGVFVAYRLVDKLSHTAQAELSAEVFTQQDEVQLHNIATSSPLSSACAQMVQLDDEPLCKQIAEAETTLKTPSQNQS